MANESLCPDEANSTTTKGFHAYTSKLSKLILLSFKIKVSKKIDKKSNAIKITLKVNTSGFIRYPTAKINCEKGG